MTTVLDVQGRRTILYVTNKTGGAVALGDVVIGDSANDEAFTTTTTAGYISSWVGVVIEANGIANNATGRVCVQGYVSTITCSASVTRGNFIKTHTVAKQGTSAGASRVTGVFAEALTTSATPSAVLFGMPDGSTGAAGSPGTPALTLSTTNSTGAAATLIATDATIAAFDATAPTTQAFGDAAATGSAGVAARRDHKHAMMAASTSAPSTYETFLAAGNITCVNANSWYTSTELALTPPAGDWLLIGHLSMTSASALATGLGAQLSSGGSVASNVLTGQTALADAETYNPASNAGGQVSLTIMAKAIGLDGSTAVHLSGHDTRASSDGVIVKTGITTGDTASKACSLVAIKITSS